MSSLASLSRAQKAQLQQVTNVTGASEKQALDFLKRNGWSVEAATDAFFESGAVPEGLSGQVDMGRLASEFERLQDPAEPGVMNGEQIMALCSELGIDPFADVAILVISYHCGCKEQGRITKQEWTAGCQRMTVATVAELKSKLAQLREQVAGGPHAKKIYEFAYAFSCEEGQKTPSLDVLKAVTPLVLVNQPLGAEWLAFLETVKRPLTRDAWQLLPDFLTQIKPDLSGYDEDAAWPTAFDDFVEFLRKRRATGGAGAGR